MAISTHEQLSDISNNVEAILERMTSLEQLITGIIPSGHIVIKGEIVKITSPVGKFTTRNVHVKDANSTVHWIRVNAAVANRLQTGQHVTVIGVYLVERNNKGRRHFIRVDHPNNIKVYENG